MSPSGIFRSVAVLSLILATAVLQESEAHPNCVGDVAPRDVGANFCSYDDHLWGDGLCCDAAQEGVIEADLDASAVTGACREVYQEVRETAPEGFYHG